MIDGYPAVIDPYGSAVDPYAAAIPVYPAMIDPLPGLVDPYAGLADPLPGIIDPLPEMAGGYAGISDPWFFGSGRAILVNSGASRAFVMGQGPGWLEMWNSGKRERTADGRANRPGEPLLSGDRGSGVLPDGSPPRRTARQGRLALPRAPRPTTGRPCPATGAARPHPFPPRKP